jgi:hypothetical protein
VSEDGEATAADEAPAAADVAVEAQAIELRRPGRLRRVAAGAYHVPAGCILLLRHVRLWPLAALPTLVCGAALGGGLALGIYALYSVEQTFGLGAGSLSRNLRLAATIALWSATLLGAVIAALAAALAVCSPLLDRLASNVLRIDATEPSALAPSGWRFGWPLLVGLLLVLAAPLIAVVGVLPWAGPVLQLLAAGLVLGALATELPLSRLEHDLPARRRWHRAWCWETFGLGLGAVLLLPLLSVLAAAGTVVGAARLVLEIEDLRR